MTKQEAAQRRVLAVTRKILDVESSLEAFNHGGNQYLPKAVAQAILDLEYSFGCKDYERAEHLCEVTAFLVAYYKSKHLSSGIEKWVARWKELHTPPTRPTKPVKPVMKRVHQHVDEET